MPITLHHLSKGKKGTNPAFGFRVSIKDIHRTKLLLASPSSHEVNMERARAYIGLDNTLYVFFASKPTDQAIEDAYIHLCNAGDPIEFPCETIADLPLDPQDMDNLRDLLGLSSH